jgi:hypothetical protein
LLSVGAIASVGLVGSVMVVPHVGGSRLAVLPTRDYTPGHTTAEASSHGWRLTPDLDQLVESAAQEEQDMTQHHRPLLSRKTFALRLVRSAGIALGILAASLGVGMLGYHGFERLSWLDSFLNASMILAGMGPAAELHTPSGKLFAGFYAIFSGIIFLSMTAVLLSPVAHRFLHRMHLEIEPESPNDA